MSKTIDLSLNLLSIRGTLASATLEFFAIDVWIDHEGMHSFYDLPEFMQGLDGLFAAEPDFSVWAHPAGSWVEW